MLLTLSFLQTMIPRSIAAEACYFWLDPKVTKRSRQKKASAHRQNTWPAFLSGLTRNLSERLLRGTKQSLHMQIKNRN